jgi:hypothetical protein
MMMLVRKDSWKSRPGVLLPAAGVLLVAILSMTALAIDGGMAMSTRRMAQGAADAAALAGAAQLYSHYPVYHGVDTPGDARAAALALALDNGYANTMVTVNIPPQSGTYHGKAGYVEVLITASMPRIFSGLFGSGNLQVTARAVAVGQWVPYPTGILALDPTSSGSVTMSGNGTINVTGAPIVVNSNSATAVEASGNGTIAAPQVFIAGGDATAGNGEVEGTVYSGAHPVPDPLAYLPQPGQTGAPPIPLAGTILTSPIGNGNATQYDVYPGSYSSFPNWGNNDVVVFHQAGANNPNGGIYYITGGFNENSATIMMAPGETGGMMMFMATGAINLAGNFKGSVTLAPLSSGPYQGMVYFQARDNSSAVSITGNGSVNLGGTWYAPAGTMSFAGNGIINMNNSQAISYDVSAVGNGTININWNGTSVPTRQIQLVE